MGRSTRGPRAHAAFARACGLSAKPAGPVCLSIGAISPVPKARWATDVRGRD